MSKLSIYETGWINQVFENRNKEYGAFQLRQENTKTSVLALFASLTLCAIVILIPKVIDSFQIEKTPIIETIIPEHDIIKLTPVVLSDPIKTEVRKTLPAVEQKTVAETDLKELHNPTIAPAEQATPNIAKTTDIISSGANNEGAAIIGMKPSIMGTGTEVGTSVTNENAVESITNLDKQPSFPGGMEKFYTYVGNNFVTPEINDEKIIRIYVSFIVEKDGSMTDIQVKNNPGYGLAKEAIRVLKSLKTKWIPGILHSKAVRTAYTLPISIQME